jgi:hypothetical protein
MQFSSLKQDPENLLKFVLEIERFSKNQNFQEQIEIRYTLGGSEKVLTDQDIREGADKDNKLNGGFEAKYKFEITDIEKLENIQIYT